jgi:hypothetical protein
LEELGIEADKNPSATKVAEGFFLSHRPVSLYGIVINYNIEK